MQRSFLLNLGKQILAPHRDKPARAYLILPITAESDALHLDLASLLFLLEGGDGELLNEIQLADQRYRLVQNLLEVRSESHAMMQEHLASATAQSGEVNLVELRRFIGPARSTKLEDTTEQLYEMQEKALVSSRDVYSKLETATRRRYPRADLFKLTERE